jgi:tRNA(Ile)-lysidine synthase
VSKRYYLLGEVDRFLQTVETASCPGVVAVSGGPDSVALLHALAAVRCARRVGPLVVAHLNHQLRGADSDADEAFVGELCVRVSRVAELHDMTYRSERIDVAARARQSGENLESVARQVRYAWLAQVAREAGARWVATGHTADDQAETVLHRLLRGTGLRGLCGIAARRGLAAGIDVIRPLLRVPRARVLAYLDALGQDYRQDPSNADLRLTRNRIRHELLPLLAGQYNPAIVPTLCRLAEQAAAVQAGEESAARALLAEVELPRAGPVLVLDRTRLASAPRHRVREVLRLVWEREGWPLGDLSFEGWERMAAVVCGEQVTVDVPGPVRVRRRGRVVQLERLPASRGRQPPEGSQ